MAKTKKTPAVGRLSTGQNGASSGTDAAGSIPTGRSFAKVPLYEGSALKNNLDDVAKQAILDMGYEEDVWVSNIKLSLGAAAIAIALYAQFGSGKFPACWWTVFACVVSYALITIVLNLYTSHYEGEAFLVTKPRRAGDNGVTVCSKMQRYQEGYTLVIADRKDKERQVNLPVSVTDYFHEDGFMAEQLFQDAAQKLLTEYEATSDSAPRSSVAVKKRL